MPYASKELVERAVALMGRTVTYKTTFKYQDDIEDLARDLARVTPLTTDAQHEAAIENWRIGAMAVVARGHHVGDSGAFILYEEEIKEICDLARRAPRPEPTMPEPEIEVRLVDQIADSAIAHRALQHQSIQGILALTEQDEIEDCHLDGDYTQIGNVTKVIMRGLRLTIAGDTLTVSSLVAEPNPEPRAVNDAPFGSSDASAWADYYLQCWPNGCADRDTMLGWFANAMMAKHDEMLESGDYVEANDPEPEPRASSALLGAARAVWESCPSFAGTVAEINHLSSVNDLKTAIEAEEARGPSEIEKLSQSERQSLVDLRARLDEVVKELTAAKNDRDEWRAMADPAVCRRQFPDGSVPGSAEECAIGWLNLYEGSRKEVERLREDLGKAMHSVRRFCGAHVGTSQNYGCASCEVEQLRKERDEVRAELAACFGYLPVVPGPALAWDGIHLEPHVVRVADEYAIMRERAEKPEPRASSDMVERAIKDGRLPYACCEGSNPNCYGPGGCLLRSEEARGPSEVEQLRKERDEAIDRTAAALAVSTPHASNDEPLREWLESYDPDDPMATTSEQDQAALAELCRRALGGK